MRPITADTLAYDLSLAVQYGDLPEAIADHLRSDLARWEAQQVDTTEGCRILKQWMQARAFFVETAAHLDSATLTRMARDYVAFLRLYGATDLNPERLVMKWQSEIARMRAGDGERAGHRNPPTTDGGPIGDYTTETSRLQETY